MNKSDFIESDDDEAQQTTTSDLDDFKLPEMDWDSLEAKLKQANQEATIQVNIQLFIIITSYQIDRIQE